MHHYRGWQATWLDCHSRMLVNAA